MWPGWEQWAVAASRDIEWCLSPFRLSDEFSVAVVIGWCLCTTVVGVGMYVTVCPSFVVGDIGCCTDVCHVVGLWGSGATVVRVVIYVILLVSSVLVDVYLL